MKKFIIIYHAPVDALRQVLQANAEDTEKVMEAWKAWAKKCGENLVNPGNPLMSGLKMNADGSSSLSQKQVCGYSVIQADNIQEAKKMLEGHPHLRWNDACEIEIYESMPLPGE